MSGGHSEHNHEHEHGEHGASGEHDHGHGHETEKNEPGRSPLLQIGSLDGFKTSTEPDEKELVRKQLKWLGFLLAGFLIVLIGSPILAGNRVDLVAQNAEKAKQKAVQKTDEEWQKQLTPAQYHVTRMCGTEPAFTGKYYATKDKGVYKCVCCGHELFSSEQKFDSGTGWPSFTAPIKEGAVENRTDSSIGAVRQEVICQHCGAHLGHVFDDGPKPTGQRFCINSASLDLEKKSEK